MEDKGRGYSTGVFSRYPELRRVFLQQVAKYGNKTAAAAFIRLSVYQVDEYRREHPEFEVEERRALGLHQRTIEEAIHKRGVEGWDEPRFNQSGQVGTIRRYSDPLLIAYARRHIPEYREGDVTTSNVNGVVEHKHSLNLDALTEQQRGALRLLLEAPEQEEMKPAMITVTDAPEEPSANGVHENGTS